MLRTAEGAVGEVEWTVLIDCDGCVMRDLACGDCVVTVLLGSLPGRQDGRHEVDDAERAALDALADSGLVPHLQLVPLGIPRRSPQQAGADGAETAVS